MWNKRLLTSDLRPIISSSSIKTYLAQARSPEVAAKGAYAKARLALDRATASTLDVNQVSIQRSAERPRIPAADANPQSVICWALTGLLSGIWQLIRRLQVLSSIAAT